MSNNIGNTGLNISPQKYNQKAFHPDFGPDVAMKPCPACSVTEIHIGWKVLFFIAIVYIALVAMGVL